LMSTHTANELGARGAKWLVPVNDAHRGLLVYVHGGSFLFGPSPLVMTLMKTLARASRMALVMPAYRLAPEHPCPAAINDIAAFFETLARSGVAAAKTVVTGEQTGANLTLAALQAGAGKTGFTPAALVFFSPWLDLTLSSWSSLINRFGISHAYSREFAELAVRLYLGTAPKSIAADDRRASPLLGPLDRIPASMMHASESDISLDDARNLHHRLKAGAVPSRLNIWPGVDHMWERYDLDYCKKSVRMSAAFIDEILYRENAPLKPAPN